MRTLLAIFIFTPILFLGNISVTQAHPNTSNTSATCNPSTGGNFPACTEHSHEGLQYELEPVLRSDITSIETLLTAILNVLLVIAVPIIVFFIIFAGFTYVTAQGNPEKIKTATRSLTYAIIGAVLILGGVAISEIIASVVSSFQT
jgi:hypothetical protein